MLIELGRWMIRFLDSTTQYLRCSAKGGLEETEGYLLQNLLPYKVECKKVSIELASQISNPSSHYVTSEKRSTEGYWLRKSYRKG